MAVNQAHFVAAGRVAALEFMDHGSTEHRFERSAAGWQARAYWEAFDNEVGRLKAESHLEEKPAIKPLPSENKTAWPLGRMRVKGDGNAAHEHIRRLTAMNNNEPMNAKESRRAVRIDRKISKLAQRHGWPASGSPL